jgi:hypothetical protein
MPLAPIRAAVFFNYWRHFMKTGFSAAVAFAFLVSSPGVFAQSADKQAADPSTYGSGESARCNQMSGEAKTQCLKDEGAKTENKSDDSASSGSSSAPSAGSASSPSAPADSSSSATSGDSSSSSGASSSAPAAGSRPAESSSPSGSESK